MENGGRRPDDVYIVLSLAYQRGKKWIYIEKRNFYMSITRYYDRDNALYDCDFTTLLLFGMRREAYPRGTPMPYKI